MKYLIIALSLILTACASTEEDNIEQETLEWNITDKQVIVEGCEKLHKEETNADC